MEQWAEKVAAEAGFTDVGHTVELFGLCPQCAGFAFMIMDSFDRIATETSHDHGSGRGRPGRVGGGAGVS